METVKFARQIADLIQNKKGYDIKILDLKNLSSIADYFVICSGTSTTHIKAISDGLEEKLENLGVKYLHKEGYNSARWILLDYGDVVVHIFHEEDRNFYKLERLWSDGIMSWRA